MFFFCFHYTISFKGKEIKVTRVFRGHIKRNDETPKLGFQKCLEWQIQLVMCLCDFGIQWEKG
jgi:hypothetical protein